MESDAIQFWSMVGTWLGSFATFSAVIVSLWLASRGSRVRLKTRVELDESQDGERKVVVFAVRNTGYRQASIKQIGFAVRESKFGRGKYVKPDVQPQCLPIDLQPGDEADIRLPWSDSDMRELAKYRHHRAYVFTIGKPAYGKMGRKIKSFLSETAKC